MRHLAGLLIAAAVLCGQPTPQATVNRFVDRVNPLIQSLRSVRLATDLSQAANELADRVASEGFERKPQEAGGRMRIGAKSLPVVRVNWWKCLEAPASNAWIDVIELPDQSAAAEIAQLWQQSHTAGIMYEDSGAFITQHVETGLDAVSAGVIRGNHVINAGVALPFRVRLWDIPSNSAAELAAIDAATDRLARRMLEITAKVLKDPAYVTWIPPASPTDDQIRMLRITSFARLWSEVKYNFVFLNQRKSLDWDGVLSLYMPRIMAAQSDDEYVGAMKEAVALLADGHTSVQGGSATDQPALRIEPVEGRPVLTGIADVPELRATGLRVGMELVTVDSVLVDQVRKKYEPIAAASTPQSRAEMVDRMLLTGPPDSTVRVVFRDARVTTVDAELKRNGSKVPARNLPWRKPAFEYQELTGGVAYAALNSFGSDAVVKRFDENFDRIQKASGLILDVRENGGGSSGNGYSIISRLIEKGVKLKASVFRTRDYKPAFRAWGRPEEWYEGEPGEIEARGDTPYTGPVVVLMGPNTFSAAEDFLVPLKLSKRATLVGAPSGGSTGQPLFIPLYHSSVRICTKWDRFADGTEFVGVGVQPDVLVKTTIADIAAGRDRVLEKAQEILREAKR